MSEHFGIGTSKTGVVESFDSLKGAVTAAREWSQSEPVTVAVYVLNESGEAVDTAATYTHDFNPSPRGGKKMSGYQIKVTRCIGAALSDSDRFGWQVSYVQRQLETRGEAETEADRLRNNPTAAETKAINEGRFVDE